METPPQDLDSIFQRLYGQPVDPDEQNLMMDRLTGFVGVLQDIKEQNEGCNDDQFDSDRSQSDIHPAS